MAGIRQFFRKIFSSEGTPEPPDVDRLRLVFRERYAHFKQLISANNKALEIMAAIEEALQGDRPFGMAFVRSCVTTVSVNVFQMVDNLQRLAPGKYDALTPRFNAISGDIDRLMRRETEISTGCMPASTSSPSRGKCPRTWPPPSGTPGRPWQAMPAPA